MTSSRQGVAGPVHDVLPTDRERPSGSAEPWAWARELAEELQQLTGSRPTVTRGGGGSVRVSVRVRELREWDRSAAVLVVLARGNRYGHRRTERWQWVWTEVGAGDAVDGREESRGERADDGRRAEG
ncbi:hypothetical protein AB0O31_28365 [Kitasatospora cineracea]